MRAAPFSNLPSAAAAVRNCFLVKQRGNHFLHVLAIILTLLVGNPALAAANPQPPSCATTHSTPELNACEHKHFEAADRVLNSEYKKTRARLPASAQAQLLEEQRAWLKGRDLACKEALQSEEGGTIWTSLYTICRADATRARTKQLRSWQAK
jgi:uncharacterized protein YecT (DUF1311 family)